MNLDEFESHYRISLEANLNQLQSMRLLIARLQVTVDEIGRSLHNLTLSFEEYVQQQTDR